MFAMNRNRATLDGQPVHLLFDRSQPPIESLDDPRLPRVIEMAGRLNVPADHPCYPTFRRLRAWSRLLDDVESGRRELYSHLSRQHGVARSIEEWLDLAADYLERQAA